MSAVEQILFWAHGLSGAAWFGAISYRTFAVDPKARAYFRDAAEFERFSVHLAHNMRYPVWAGLLTCGCSGAALAGLRWNPSAGLWGGLMLAKLVAWLGALGLFWYVSYVFWPWRSLASPEEYERYGRRNRELSLLMVALAGAGFLLGQACRLAA